MVPSYCVYFHSKEVNEAASAHTRDRDEETSILPHPSASNESEGTRQPCKTWISRVGVDIWRASPLPRTLRTRPKRLEMNTMSRFTRFELVSRAAWSYVFLFSTEEIHSAADQDPAFRFVKRPDAHVVFRLSLSAGNSIQSGHC